MPTTVTQTVDFEASVERVYKAIADSAEHSKITGAPAELATEAGGAFTTHGGAIEGFMLEMITNERIVQAWRPGDWPAGVFSLVRYDFSGDDSTSQIALTHTGLPEEGSEHIAEGWEQRYWGPLAEYLSTP